MASLPAEAPAPIIRPFFQYESKFIIENVYETLNVDDKDHI